MKKKIDWSYLLSLSLALLLALSMATVAAPKVIMGTQARNHINPNNI